MSAEPTEGAVDRQGGGAFAAVAMALLLAGMWLAGFAVGDTGATREVATARIKGAEEALAEVRKASEAQAAKDAELYTSPPVDITPGGPTRGAAPPDWQPPKRFQKALLAAVYFAEQDEVTRRCGPVASGGPSGACETQDGNRKPILVMPNPCAFTDDYALMLCHEIGHGHGWPSDHRGGHWTRARLEAERIEAAYREAKRSLDTLVVGAGTVSAPSVPLCGAPGTQALTCAVVDASGSLISYRNSQ